MKKPDYVTTAGFILFLVIGASTGDTPESTSRTDEEVKAVDTLLSEEENN